MFPSTVGPLESYNSLQDHHLMGYYSNPKKLRHLRKMGLMQRCSVLRRKLEYLSRMERVEKVKMAKQHPPGLEEDFDPSLPGTLPPSQSGRRPCPAPLLYPPRPQSSMDILHQRLGITPSEVDLYHTVTKPRIVSGGLSRSPYSSTGPVIQPRPPSAPRPLSRTAPPSHEARGRQGTTPKRRSTIRRGPVASSDTNKLQDQPTVTLHYTGPSLRLEGVPELTALSDVIILQQHCGGNTVCVFKARVKAQDQISFTSRRHRDCPFGISIYVDGMIDTRVSACCEYRHKTGKHLGCKNGHFKLVKVSGGKPCIQCQLSEGERGVGKLSQQKKTATSSDKQGESERDKSSVAMAILKDLQSPQVDGASSSAGKELQLGINDQQHVERTFVADESAQRPAGGQENGHHVESGQEPTFTSIEQQYEEDFGSGDVSFENGDKGSDKDSDFEVDSSSDTHSDDDSDNDSDGDNASVARPSGPLPSSGAECEPVDRKHTHNSEKEDGGSEKLGRKESNVVEEAKEELDDEDESGKEGEKEGEVEEERDEGGEGKEVESEGEEEVDKVGKEDKAEIGGNSGNQVAGDSGREGMEDWEDKCDGTDLAKIDGDENEAEDAVEVVLSKEDCRVEGDNGSQLTVKDNDRDQVCELLSPSLDREEGDPVVFPSSQEDEPGVGVVKEELEGGATNGMEPPNIIEQREIEREELGESRSDKNGQGRGTVEEQPENINNEHPGDADGVPQQSASLQLARSSSISSVSSLSSSEYSLASDKDN